MVCDDEKYKWQIIEIISDINNQISYTVSNGYAKRRVYEHQIEPLGEPDFPEAGFTAKKYQKPEQIEAKKRNEK